MSDQSRISELFDRWEQVWHEGRYDLVPSCVAPTYVRHDEMGDRTVTPDSYAAELARNLEARPNTRIVVYDHSFEGNRAWFRFTLRWNDPNSGEVRTRAGMQVYRVEAGKLAETWVTFSPLGSAWTDQIPQERWTSPPPAKH